MIAIEEKTPKGYVLKINVKKMTFIAFDRLGSTVYADENSANTVHTIPHICFLGKNFNLKRRMTGDYTLLKVSHNKILLPYHIVRQKDLHYYLLDTNERIDMVPVKIELIENVLDFIKMIEAKQRPEIIFIESSVDDNDLIILQNRYPAGEFRKIDVASKELIVKNEDEEETESHISYNLNMMSTNPVFLARIHLRDLKLSNVRQLLFDFDLSFEDCSYIQSFLHTLSSKESRLSEHDKGKVRQLGEEFTFYISLIQNQKDDIFEQIDKLTDGAQISTYTTLLAKAKSVIEEKKGGPDLDIVDYENRLLDKKEELEHEQSKSN